MGALVVGTRDNTVLGELADALTAKRMTTGKRHRLLVVVIVRLETDTALKNGVHF